MRDDEELHLIRTTAYGKPALPPSQVIQMSKIFGAEAAETDRTDGQPLLTVKGPLDAIIRLTEALQQKPATGWNTALPVYEAA